MRSVQRVQAMMRKAKFLTLLVVIGTISCLFVLYVLSEHLPVILKEYQRLICKNIDIYSWLQNVHSSCDGNFQGYGHQFAVLKNVVIKSREEVFQISCPGSRQIEYSFDYGNVGTHLNRWLQSTISSKKSMEGMKYVSFRKFTVAVKRYEYANLYHTMTDWYNVFLVGHLLNKSVDNMTILLFDNSTKGHMDDTWNTLYGEVVKVPLLNKDVQVDTLAWNILGYESPLNYHRLTQLPLVNEFHSFFLRKHKISATKQLNCRNVTVFFLWRQDYVSHPGNQKGVIKRKIANENELIESVSAQFPTAHAIGDNLDRMPFSEQLKIISSTDILVSMHGAGLSHILFLPGHAAVIELFPYYWVKFPGMIHFEAMARWRGLQYMSWQNLNPSNEHDNWRTYIPPAVAAHKIKLAYDQMCGKR